jgi:hypothetical protein
MSRESQLKLEGQRPRWLWRLCECLLAVWMLVVCASFIVTVYPRMFGEIAASIHIPATIGDTVRAPFHRPYIF